MLFRVGHLVVINLVSIDFTKINSQVPFQINKQKYCLAHCA